MIKIELLSQDTRFPSYAHCEIASEDSLYFIIESNLFNGNVIEIIYHEDDLNDVQMDPDNSIIVLYWVTFEKLYLNLEHIQLFKGSLVDFSRE